MNHPRTIRFCRTPLSFTDLPEPLRASAERDAALPESMGDQCWSFVELLEHGKDHPDLGRGGWLAMAMVNCIELGLIRTEESAFLEEVTRRFERALDGTFTFQDIRWRANQLGVRVGGAGNAWTINSIAYSMGSLLRGVMNSIETVYTSPENGEQFLVTVTRKKGKSPMDIRRELLNQIHTLAEGGGATQDQLQAILDANRPPSNPVGLAATSPEEEAKYPWVRWLGDHFICLRRMNDEPIDFPGGWSPELHADYANRHERCMPSEPASMETITKFMRDETGGVDGEVEDG